MRAPSSSDGVAEYMAFSEDVSVSGVVWVGAMAVNGRMRATTTAAARRGEMPVAISKGVVPRGTSRRDPSGSWTRIWVWIGSVLTPYRIPWAGAKVGIDGVRAICGTRRRAVELRSITHPSR